MAGEVTKVVQQDQSAELPAVANPPAKESRDVEMSEAPPTKEPEQPAAAPPADSAKPETLGNAAVGSPKELTGEPVQEPPKEPVVAVDTKPADPEPAKTGSELSEPVGPLAVTTDAVEGAGKTAEVTSENPRADPVEATIDRAETIAEAAEEASAKMLAANLETPSNGDANVDVSESKPTGEEAQKNDQVSPVTGGKRKAGDTDGANGNSSNKKSNVETAAEAPTTNGSAATRKLGRPKKEKRAPAPVGKTARRTRSQGAADLDTA